MPDLCACGCGDAAVYAARHVAYNIREGITDVDYVVMDCGYETPCWIWKGRRVPRYGNVRVRGTQMSVHRAMFIQTKGPIPTGAVVDHLCSEKRCIHPDHLQLSTIGANVRRSVGFNPTGLALAEIVSREQTAKALAVKYGVSSRTIDAVRKRVRLGLLA